MRQYTYTCEACKKQFQSVGMPEYCIPCYVAIKEQRIADTISGDLMRDEMSIDTEGREWA